MSELMADVFALYLKAKSFHWHMNGAHFRDYPFRQRRGSWGAACGFQDYCSAENYLQISLLIRSTHGLMPTQADEAELAARGAGAVLSGPLRVSAATCARLHIVPLLPDFPDNHPDLLIDVIMDDRTIDLMGEAWSRIPRSMPS